MFSKSVLMSLSTAAAVVAMLSAAYAEGYTTRIEPRPFYGAVVTLEEGVRVIRPLPPTRHVIINPDHATPLSLGFNETRVYENRTIRNYVYNDGGNGGERGGSSSYGRAGYTYGPSFVGGGQGRGGYVPGRSSSGQHGGMHHRGGHHGGHRGGHR